MAKPLDDLRVLLPFASADSRAFVQTLIRGFEVENLKRVLRRHLSGRSGECGPAERAFAPAALYDAGTAARVPLALLREASSASDLVARLDGTSFHRPLADALPVAESTGSAFPLEIALDDDQIAACWRAAGRLSGGNREKTRLLLGVEADVLALLWAYRGRFLLGLGADEVLPRMPYFGARLAPNDRRAAAESETAAALAARIASGPYAGLLEEDGSIAPDRVDLRAARLLLAQARAVRAGLRFHLGQVVAFLWIADREVRDIGAVAECVHYGLGTAAMPRYVAGWPS
jgi:vacuolar-type H+-ATPase subunit C/Vma6